MLTGVGAAGAGLLTTPGTAAATLASQPTDGDPAHAAPQPRDIETFLDDIIPGQLDEHDIAGATIAVGYGDDPTVAKGYGYADVEAETPVRADETLFDIASVSKPVTGTAVMRAVEARLVELETDVNKYLDAFSLPETYPDPITLEHLGTHTAGFAPQHIGEYTRNEDALQPLGDAVAEDPPVRICPPGDIASYSNYGFALAGHIIGTAADTTFAEYVQRQVFVPLGMDRSTFRQLRPDEFADAMTKGYASEDGRFREQDVRMSWRLPAGGMAATATDMAAFMRMRLQQGQLDGDQFLPSETVTGMLRRVLGGQPSACSRWARASTCSSPTD